MLRLLLILMLFLSQLTGCAWSPGLAFDSGDFESDESAESEPEPLPVTLVPITPSLIETQSKEWQTSLPVNNTVADVPE